MANVKLFLGALLWLSCCTGAGRLDEETPSAQIPNASLYEEDGLWGYKDPKGKILIPAQYQMAEPFSETGCAYVIDSQGWAFIRSDGQVLLRPFIYDNGPDPFHEGLARFTENNLLGFYDVQGRIIIEAEFDFAWPFEAGQARVCKGCEKRYDGEHYSMEGGSQWFIDKNGKKVNPGGK